MAGKQRTKRVFVAAQMMTWVVLTLVARTVLAWWGFGGAASTSLAVVICLPQLVGALAYARVNWAATYPHPVSLWGVAAV